MMEINIMSHDHDANTLEQVKKLIDEKNVKNAMAMLNSANDKSVWSQNARAVCLMRMGKHEEAVKTLTPLVYPDGSVIINLGVPEKVKLNLAEAMLLTGNVAGAMTLMESVKEDCIQLQKLRQTVAKWKKSLSFFAKIEVICGMLPYESNVQVDSPYGEL
jgi:Flp pilus assembly protein TadD